MQKIYREQLEYKDVSYNDHQVGWELNKFFISTVKISDVCKNISQDQKYLKMFDVNLDMND